MEKSGGRGGVEVGNKPSARKGVEKKNTELPAPHNNPIISLINDVMKANSVKIACKQLYTHTSFDST